MTDTHDSTAETVDLHAAFVPTSKIEAVMAWVTESAEGTAARAAAALAAEQASPAPRSRLIKNLEKITAPAPVDPGPAPDPAEKVDPSPTQEATGVELPPTFSWWGETIAVVDEDENTTVLNERGVELAVAGEFLSAVAELIDDDGRSAYDSALEIGGVIGLYVDDAPWAVVQSLDQLREVPGDRDWIVAISIAHHLPVPAVDDAAAVIELLRSKLTPAGRLLVTAPLGYHEAWDQLIVSRGSGAVRECTLVRDGDGRWVQTDEIEFRPYGVTNPWADAVWIAEFECVSQS